MKTPDREDELLPVRNVNAYVFCPRLFWLEEVAGDFADNEHTVEGQDIHRRVDRPGGSMPAPDSENNDGQTPQWHTRSLWLSDEELGVSGKLDLVELFDDDTVMPVDYKKGRPAPGDDDEDEMWPTDRVQLTLQALLLRAHGYVSEQMAVWYHAARKRIERDVTDAMIREAKQAVADAYQTAQNPEMPPPPLVDSPKCPGCSLNAICQPDEVNALGRDHLAPDGMAAAELADETAESASADEIRRIQPPRTETLPLYVHTQGAYVGKSGHCLKIKPPKSSDDEPREVGLGKISQLNLMGAVQVTTQAMQACLRNDIPVAYFASSGWFYGQADPVERKQVHRRIAQHEVFETETALEIARVLISDKIANARTLIRRNSEDDHGLDEAIAEMKRLYRIAAEAFDAETLLGFEGNAARHYWGAFDTLVSADDSGFEMNGRNRRPPEDEVNALLSYGYALLVKDCHLAVRSVGLDPHLGVYHTPHHGRPAMALDLMEVFRPLIVDSAVLRIIRRGDVAPKDFIHTGQAVAMKKRAKGALIRAYERRMDSLITHPVFGYRISYRRILHVQARLLARVLTGELDEMPGFRTR